MIPVHATTVLHESLVTKVEPLMLGLLGVLSSACSEKIASADHLPISGELVTATMQAQPTAAATGPIPPEDDSALRRGYGVVDMRYESCVAPDAEQILIGKGCTSGILVYGPYVSVPSNSQIEVAFEIKPEKKVEIYADVVTQMGQHVLAGLSPLTVEAGDKQHIGYFVNVIGADVHTESRIGLRTDEPVQLLLSNLTMTVH